ncbi:MAG: 7-carboxy-7-deazaguanine synthase QueE [Halobacteriovoraceae bacterium]|nr:7-carboxy-7-deazaguanine synthase QueE [Halobacteriovoraceae bacterium]
MPINSIYLATEGEGIFVGLPQVFVRFQGCAVGCLNCDSKDTWEFKNGNLTLEEVISEIEKYKIKRVSITGGDPLHPKLLPLATKLALALKGMKYYLNIEAAGTKISHELFDCIDFVSFDFKTPSTGIRTPLKHIMEMAKQYVHKFQIKSVIENNVDFDFVVSAYQQVKNEVGEINFPWVITPSYNTFEEFPQKRFQEILEWNYRTGYLFRVIGQQHKWIYGPLLKEV